MSSEDSTPAPFALPPVHFNPSGWGPATLPEQYESVPFATFNRYDRLGKCADFGGYLRFQARHRYGRGEDNAELTYRYDEGEAKEFSLVDTAAKTARRPQGGQRPQRGRGGAAARGGRGTAAAGAGGIGTRGYDDRGAQGGMGGRKPAQTAGGRYARAAHQNNRGGRMGGPMHGGQIRREPSVKVEADWLLLEQFNLAELHKLSAAPTGPPEDVKWAGVLAPYDEDYDRITTKAPRKMRSFGDRDVMMTTTHEDELFEELAGEDAGNVFATDAILAHLMASPRTVLPWDIVATYLPGGIIFLDVRDPVAFDMATVNENASQQPPEPTGDNDINAPSAVAIEASVINQSISQVVLAPNNGKPVGAPAKGEPSVAPHPYQAGKAEAGYPDGQPAALAYRYRRWKLAGDIAVVARTTVHAVARKPEGAKFVNVYALNEWDAKLSGVPDYRKTFDTQRSNLLASEMKNNAARLAKYTITSLLSGADSMKLAFVSRAARADPDNHVIVGTVSYAPPTFAAQQGLSDKNMWGILKWFVGLVRTHAVNLQEGAPDDEYVAKFVLAREPNAPKLSFYSVPADAFDAPEAGDEGEEGAPAEDGGADWEGAGRG